MISPNPSLHNEIGRHGQKADVPDKRLVPAVKVLCRVDASVSRVLRTQRQDGLPGLSKVWKPTPLVRNLREVTRKSVIQIEDVFPVECARNGDAGNLRGGIY